MNISSDFYNSVHLAWQIWSSSSPPNKRMRTAANLPHHPVFTNDQISTILSQVKNSLASAYPINNLEEHLIELISNFSHVDIQNQIIQFPNQFPEEFIQAAVNRKLNTLINGKHPNLALTVLRDSTLSPTAKLCFLSSPLILDSSCNIEFWKKLFNNGNAYNNILSFMSQDFKYLDKLVQLVKLSPDLTIELFNLYTPALRKTIFDTPFSSEKEIKSYTKLIEKFGASSWTIKQLEGHLINYPSRINILCEIFLLDNQNINDFLYNETNTVIHFLDIAERIIHFPPQLALLVNFPQRDDFTAIYPMLSIAPQKWLVDLISNLSYLSIDFREDFENLTHSTTANPQTFFLYATVGLLAFDIAHFDIDRIQRVQNWIDKSDFPIDQIIQFIKFFSNPHLVDINGISTALWIALSREETPALELIRTFPGYHIALLRLLMSLISNQAEHNDILSNLLNNTGKYRYFSRDSLGLCEAFLRNPQLPNTFVDYLACLIESNKDKLVLFLIDKWNNGPESQQEVVLLAAEAMEYSPVAEIGHYTTHPVPSLQKLKNIQNEIENNFEQIKKLTLLSDEKKYETKKNIILIIICRNVIENNKINITFLSSLFQHLRNNSKVPDHFLDDLEGQVTLLEAYPSLCQAMECLSFRGKQDGHFALLIRTVLGMTYMEPVTDLHLLLFTLQTFLMTSRQNDWNNSCGGVSLLNSLLTNRPQDFIKLIRDLVDDDCITVKNKNISFRVGLHLFIDQEFLNTKIPTTEHWDRSALNLGVQEILNYFKISNSQIIPQLKSIFNHVSAFSYNDVLAYLVKFPDFQVYNTLDCPLLLQFKFLFLNSISLYNHRALEGVLISFDPSHLRRAHIIFEEYFSNIIHNNLTAIPKNVRELLISRISKKIQSRMGICYNSQKDGNRDFGRHAFFDQNKSRLNSPPLLDSPELLQEFILDCATETCSETRVELSHVKFDAHGDFQWETLKNSLKYKNPQFESIIISILQKFPEYVAHAKENPLWKLKEGVYSKRSWSRSHRVKSLEQKALLTLHARSPSDMIDFLIPYLARTRNLNNAFVNMHNHAVNFITHDSLEAIVAADDKMDCINKMYIKPAQKIALNKKIDSQQLKEWALYIENRLPNELKQSWVKAFSQRQIVNTPSIFEARKCLWECLVSIHGGVNLVEDNYEVALDTYAMKFYNTEYKSKAFIHFADSNYLNTSLIVNRHFALYFSPLTLSWELWDICADNSNPTKMTKKIFFGDNHRFTVFLNK